MGRQCGGGGFYIVYWPIELFTISRGHSGLFGHNEDSLPLTTITNLTWQRSRRTAADSPRKSARRSSYTSGSSRWPVPRPRAPSPCWSPGTSVNQKRFIAISTDSKYTLGLARNRLEWSFGGGVLGAGSAVLKSFSQHWRLPFQDVQKSKCIICAKIQLYFCWIIIGQSPFSRQGHNEKSRSGTTRNRGGRSWKVGMSKEVESSVVESLLTLVMSRFWTMSLISMTFSSSLRPGGTTSTSVMSGAIGSAEFDSRRHSGHQNSPWWTCRCVCSCVCWADACNNSHFDNSRWFSISFGLFSALRYNVTKQWNETFTGRGVPRRSLERRQSFLCLDVFWWKRSWFWLIVTLFSSHKVPKCFWTDLLWFLMV